MSPLIGRALLPAGLVFLAAVGSAMADATIPSYRSTTLEKKFFAEGAAFADVNRDGSPDAIAGPFWYAGPDFKDRHEIYPPVPFDPLQYSDNFFAFPYDFNSDGWPDVLVVGFPGKTATWYENPGKADHPWAPHVVFNGVDNESPALVRLFPGQPPVLLCNHDKKMGYATFDPARPAEPWTFHAVSEAGRWVTFTHGLGFGDINGDGRNDLLEAGGWWEQPAALADAPRWKFHAYSFAPGVGGAQMAVFDFNGDGRNDVVTARNAHGYGLSWYEQVWEASGGIAFREHPLTSTQPEERIKDVQFSQPHALVLADVDQDGLPDVVTGKRWWAHGPTGDVDAGGKPQVWAFLLRRDDKGGAAFTPVLLDEDAGIGTQFDSADVNADGFPDFIIANKRGTTLLRSTVNGLSGDVPDAVIESAEKEKASFHLPPGFEIQLVAAEPAIRKPLNLAFDARGRLWVTATGAYPWPARRDALGQPIAGFAQNWKDNELAFRARTQPPEPPEYGRDTIHVLSDFGPDGRARQSQVFADGLNIPIGLTPLPRAPGAKGDTVIAYSIPAIWRLTDTDGDGQADRREKLYGDFGFKDTHGMSSNYTYWVDGWIYGTHGFANHSEVKDGRGVVTVLDSGNTYRFRPDGSRFEQWTWGQTNPFGLVFDPRGDIYTADSHSKPVYLVQPGGYYEGINKNHDGLGFAPSITDDDHGSSAIAGITYYAATQFPAEYRGNLFNGNPVTRRVNRDRLDWQGSTPRAIRQPDFLRSDDPSFRPVQVLLGPDGAIWISDFYNPIIGHYEVPLTHPSRDFAHGRIWRIVWRGLQGEVPAPALPDLSGADASALLAHLTDPNLTVRRLAANELVERIGPAAVPGLRQLAAIEFAQPDSPAALPVAQALERLGASDDALLFDTLAFAGDGGGAVALRVLANRADLGARQEAYFRVLLDRTTPGLTWRAVTEVFARHPAGWQAPLLLAMAARAPWSDNQLNYGLRHALKAVMGGATAGDLRTWGAASPAAAELLTSVCLAVPTAAASEYLLGFLAQTQGATSHAGELARHAIKNLPPERYAALASIIQPLRQAERSQQLAIAEGIAAALAAHPDQVMPEEVTVWMRGVLVGIAGEGDWKLATRAMEAAQPIMFPEMQALLRRLIVEPAVRGSSAKKEPILKALPPSPEDRDLFVWVLNDGTASAPVRKLAVDRLASPALGAAGETALADALPTASSELALAIAIALAKTDSGAQALLAQVEAGRAPGRLLVHGYVAPSLQARDAAIRERAAALTRDLPSENARLDAVIEARFRNYSPRRATRERGEAVFTAQCAPCHRIKDHGGSIGPSLDGLASRGVARVMEDILDPSRNIDPMFRLSTVAMKQGDPRTGMNLQEQGDHYLLTEGTGTQVSIAKDQVKGIERIPTSLMPGVFENALSEEEFFDLIAFLTKS